MRFHAVALAAAGLVAVLDGGCAFRALRRDVQRLDRLTLIGGHVATPADDGTPIVVGLLEAGGAQVETFVLERPDAYFFVVPGFDESHTSILRSAAVSTTLSELLAETVR